MEAIQLKQKILCKHFQNNNIPRKNICTLNIKEAYDDELDETWKLFNGILPAENCINLNFKPITMLSEFDKKITYADLTPEFLIKFKNQYINLINLFYDIVINKLNIDTIIKNTEHDGSKNTKFSTKNNDIDIYLFKDFNYNTDFNESEKKDFDDLITFYDSIWDKREEIYKKDVLCKLYKISPSERPDWRKKKSDYCHNLSDEINWDFFNENSDDKLVKKKQIKIYKDIIKNKELENIEKKYIIYKNNYLNWDVLYRIDGLYKNGIIDDLGLFSSSTIYNKINKLFKIRKLQLEDLKRKMESGIKCNKIDTSYINQELEKINKNDDSKYTSPTFIKNSAIKKCNESQWSIKETSEVAHESKIINKEELYCLPILYQFIDPYNKDEPKSELPLNKRQYVYGSGDTIKIFKKNKQYFRSNPNESTTNETSENCFYNLIYYSQILNKLETACAINSDILFPLRFILKNPFKEDNKRLLSRYPENINPISFLKYTLVGLINIKRIDPLTNKDIQLYNFIFKTNDCKKTNFHHINGQYSHFIITNYLLEKVSISNFFPNKNITWDEFSMIYLFLKRKKDVYYYKKDEEYKNDTLNLFIHNKKYEIPPNLLKDLSIADDSIYNKINKKYTKFYNDIDSSFILNDGDYDILFPSIEPKKILGGSKLYNCEYITQYKHKLYELKFRLDKYDSKNLLEYKQHQLFGLFNVYLLLNNNVLNEINYKNFNFNIDKMINIRYYESIYNFDLIINKNRNILEINNKINYFINNCIYIANNKKISVTSDSLYTTNYDLHVFLPYINYTNRNYEKSLEYNESKIDIYNKYITKDELTINVNKKYNLIFSNISTYTKPFYFYQEEQSLNIKFIFIIYSLLRLEKNGDLVIGYGDISTIQSYQIINNLIPYFDKIIIYDTETKSKYKQTGTDVICKKFKDNFNINDFKNIIDEIFILDRTLGNNFHDINNNLYHTQYNKKINIYIQDYSINKKYDKKLLNDITEINNKKHFLLIKNYYDVIFLIKKFINTDKLKENIIKYQNYIRIVCSYKKAIELNLIKDQDNTPALKSYVAETVKELKKNNIAIKNIGIYKKLNKKDIDTQLNIEKLHVIQDFYYFIHGKEGDKKNNIFDLINFDKYKQNIYNLLENNKDVYLSFNSDNLYNIDIVSKRDDSYLLTTENKNFIDTILINYLNEIIDNVYDKQITNYYLDMYKL